MTKRHGARVLRITWLASLVILCLVNAGCEHAGAPAEANSRDLLPALARSETCVSVHDDRRRAVILPAGTVLRVALGDLDGGHLRYSLAAVARSANDDRIASVEAILCQGNGSVVHRLALPMRAGDAWTDVQAPIDHAPDAALELRVADGDAAIASLRHVTTTRPPPPNVLIYLIDTLRPDHLSAYGYARPTTPVLDRLARDGVLFAQAYSTAPWTRPATASLLTSLYPSFHGAVRDRALVSEVTTIAERLRSACFFTAAFVANGNVAAPGLNFEQGFERFVSIVGSGAEGHARSGELNDVMLPALAPLRDEAFLLYVHAIDPHAPYDAPAPYRGRFAGADYHGPIAPDKTLQRDLVELQPVGADLARVCDLYDEEIRYQDAMLGVLLDRLTELELLERTIVIVTSDHGEEFAEHASFGHGRRLWEEQIRVPLVIRFPHGALGGRRIEPRVTLLDIVPTLLSQLGLDGADECQGRDLMPLVSGEAMALADAEMPVYCEERIDAQGERQIFSLMQGSWKLILRRGKRELPSLFNLAADPLEQNDLASAEVARVRAMHDALDAFPRQFPQPRLGAGPEFRADETTRKQLEALGYGK